MERFAGRVALVTGASAGIGEAVVEMLASAGMKVAFCARRKERVDALAARLAPAEVLPLRCDVRDEAQIAATVQAVRDRFGGIDVLVNNAGLAREAPLMTGETERWREMLEVNVLALAVFTREALADMRREGFDGHVVHVASMAAYRVPPGPAGMYSASKYAVRALTEGLRQELRAAKSDIRVSAISPGFVETEFAGVASDWKQDPDEYYSRYPCLQPTDIANAVKYVLSQPPYAQVHDVLLRPTRQPT